MVSKLSNLKILLGFVYIATISIGLFYLLSYIDIRDLMSYEFIKLNKDIILKYKTQNFLFLTILFFLFCIIWVLLLGFAMPLLIFAGFVFGKWWGILIVLVSTTIGATLLYLLVGIFFRDMVQKKLAQKYSNLSKFFRRNDIIYFMFFRFIGGGGTPYAIQNILPILFDMPMKNYVIATFVGSMPSMFVTVAIGSGLESVIDKNDEFGVFNVINSPEIYLPIIGFIIILIIAFFVKRIFFMQSIKK